LSGALESSMKYYRHWLSPIRFLAINIKEARKLVNSASGAVGIWSMLYVACPKLETLFIVVNGPFNNRKVTFQKLHNVAGPEDLGSHDKWKWYALLFLYESLLRMQQKGGWRDLKLTIVNIDTGNALKFERSDKKKIARREELPANVPLYNKARKAIEERK
jgi:hypothetical protein